MELALGIAHGSTSNTSWPITAASSSSAEVLDHDVRPVLVQRSGVADAVDPDDTAKVTRPAGLDAGERVLEHRRLCRLGAERRGAARNVSGAGLPGRCSRSATMPSIRTSNRSSIPAATSTSLQFLLEDTTARRSPASRAASTYRTEPS